MNLFRSSFKLKRNAEAEAWFKKAQATADHSAWEWAEYGRFLDSWSRYKEAGAVGRLHTKSYRSRIHISVRQARVITSRTTSTPRLTSPSNSPTAATALSPDELATLTAQRHAEMVQQATDRFDSELPSLTDQLRLASKQQQSLQLYLAENTVGAVRSHIELLMQGPLRDDKRLASLNAEVENQLSAIRELEHSATEDLEVLRSEWGKTGFGTIANWTIRIRNNSRRLAYTVPHRP